MSISILEADENELVDFRLLDTIPKSCQCGNKLCIDDSFQNLICTSEKCTDRLADRVLKLTRDMGQTQWSKQDCVQIVNKLKLSQPYQLFIVPRALKDANDQIVKKLIEVCDPQGKQGVKSVDNIHTLADSKLRQYQLEDIAKFSEHKDLSDIQKDLFRGLKNISEAYIYFKLWPVTFIANRLGLKTDEEVCIASEIQSRLLEVESELKYGEKRFSVKNDSIITITLATSGIFKSFRNNTEFIDAIYERYNGMVAINLVPQIYQKVEAYINDYDKISQKYAQAMNINEQYQLKLLASRDIAKSDLEKLPDDSMFHTIGEKIFIGQADEFIARLDRIYKTQHT